MDKIKKNYHERSYLCSPRLPFKRQEQGYKPKYKSLEDVVKLTRKMEAKLIGYDEMPTNGVAPYATGINNLKAREPSRSGGSSKVHPISVEPKKLCASWFKPVRQAPSIRAPPESQQIESNDIYSCLTDSQTAGNNLGGSSKKSAKSRLYEICAANFWKPPIFECCKETGPSHLKEFTFVVVVEIDELEQSILEITGMPLAKKKDAAENAAEGALWYLKHEGYLLVKD